MFGIAVQHTMQIVLKKQIEAARIVTGLTRSVHLDWLYKEVGWVPLSKWRKEHKLITFHRIIRGFVPDYLQDLLPPLVDDSQYHLRNYLDFIAPMCRLEIYKKYFFPSAISLWNSLPIDIRNIIDECKFKKAVSTKSAPPPKHFFFGERKFSIIHVHTRLRNIVVTFIMIFFLIIFQYQIVAFAAILPKLHIIIF